jgi:23S rRNA (guanosine2251-2'-O)-methyltransferase
MEEEDILFGRNTVREAVKKGRGIDRILVAEGMTDGSIHEIVRMARDQKLIVTEVKRQKLDDMCLPFGYGGRPGNHQGIVAIVSACEYVEVEDILRIAEEKGEPPFLVILDGITDTNNFGAIIRSAECFGAHGIIISKRRSAPLNSSVFKASSGAAEYMPVAREVNLTATINKLKEKGLWIVAAVMDGQKASETDLKGPVALVIGSEGEGISRLVEESCDFRVSIGMEGRVGSLNASVAAAVLMYEKRRQEGK